MDNNGFLKARHVPEDKISRKDSHEQVVMVVEDDPDSMLLMSTLLSSYGYRVIEAANGEKALTLLDKNYPKLIFMDLQMPVMDGYTAAQRIREMDDPYRSIPIIGLVADACKEEYEKCQAAGIDDYISKPFRLEEILGKLKILPAA
ncbi:MAG: response regulator [Chitinophagaceae bacterium]|nr:response regulator [Chitinophagaceae bacterium]